MNYELPDLPYTLDALEPHISKETLEYHYKKHHAGYVKKLNNLVEGSDYEGMSLEAIIQDTVPGDAVFNNAAQIWNHSFYWNSMAPEGSGKPGGGLGEQIEKTFGGFEKLQQEFIDAAKGKFGSGWVWLYVDKDGSLEITTTDDADSIIRFKQQPLIVCDVWEHAYYIDYRNDRGKYLDSFWQLVNWDFAEKNYNN